jgi:glycine reductase
MTERVVRVIHFVNQFFAGIGGEDKADQPIFLREGPVGPGIVIQRLLADQGHVIATIVAGDNYVSTDLAAARQVFIDMLREQRPDVLVAGPAFNSGRYGMACAEICQAASDLGIPSVMAMFPENPAREMYPRGLYVIPTGELALSMPKVLPGLAHFALRLARGEQIGPAAAEGYLPRGRRQDFVHAEPAVERALTMLKARLAGQPFNSEIPVEVFEQVPQAEPVTTLDGSRVAVVTTGGIVPTGNPDRLRERASTQWSKYWIGDLDGLAADRFEPIHGGYDSTWARESPDRVVPVDALRELEREHVIRSLHPYYYVTVGVGTSAAMGKKFGQEIAAELHHAGVDVVVLTAT